MWSNISLPTALPLRQAASMAVSVPVTLPGTRRTSAVHRSPAVPPTARPATEASSVGLKRI